MVEEMGGLHAVQRLMLVGLQDDGLAGNVVVVHVRAHPQSGLREALFQLQTEVHLLHLIGIVDEADGEEASRVGEIQACLRRQHLLHRRELYGDLLRQGSSK